MTKTLSLAARPFHRILRDERGVAGVEFTAVMPLLLSLFLGGFAMFDLFRAEELNERAGYTLADLVSRESMVDDARYDEWKQAHAILLTGRTSVSSSFSVVSAKRAWKAGKDAKSGGTEEADSEFVIDWSHDSATGTEVPAASVDLDALPYSRVGGSVLIVTSRSKQHAGLGRFTKGEPKEFEVKITVRPRYVGSIGYRSDSTG